MSTLLYHALKDTNNPLNVVAYSVPSNLRNQYPSILRLDNGNLYCAYMHYGAVSGDLASKIIKARISTNNGLTWGDSFTILNTRTGKIGVECPNLYKKSNGNIICITLERNDDATYYGQIYQYESTDGGLTFDAGKLIYESSDYQTNDYIWIPSNHLLVTQTGRLIISIMTSRDATYYTDTMNTIVRHLYSDDEGDNWSLSATVLSAASSGNEALIGSGRMVQLSNGTIVEAFRTRSRYARITKSTDNGATWSNPPTKSGTLLTSNADLDLFCHNDVIYAFVSRPNASVPQTAASATRVYFDLWKSIDGGDIFTFVKNLLFKNSVYIFTEPIVYDHGAGIFMFCSHYPFINDNQDLRFEKYTYVQLES